MDDDEFDFSDVDLDDLPTTTLQHLEASAFHATQQQQQQQQLHQQSQHRQPQHQAAPESDYGLNDGDEVVNLDDDDDYPANPPNHGTQLHNDYMDLSEAPRRSQADPTQLLHRIKLLEQDKARERRAAIDLKAKLQTKSGEADTLRRRHDADSRRFERQLADQQQTHSADVARLRAEVEKLRRESESAQTDSLFHQHEAREAGMGMARRTGKTMASRPKSGPGATTTASPAGTPKRAQKTRGMPGDGFDDDDVVMASPSRRDKLRLGTPKQAGKRKRQVLDQSPIPLPALQLSEPRSRAKEKEPEMASEPRFDAALFQHLRQDDGRFLLLHRLLAHPASNGTDRILEALAQYSFPSMPSKKLSSIVYDALAPAAPADVHELALQICFVFLDLWKRCQTEKFYAPIHLILDALHFILACEPVETSVRVAERVVPLVIASVDLVSDPISKAAKGGDQAMTDLFSASQRDIASHIDVLDCLELLHVIATSCVSSLDVGAIARLWHTIPSTFACMLLVKEQPHPQITMMLHILSTSGLANSLGPITTAESTHDNQASNEDALINRLTNLFTETPRAVFDPSQPPVSTATISETDLWDLRLLVLSVLTQFSITPYGCDRLAQNRLCIGRLIKYLDFCITTLYRQPLSPTQDQKVGSINTTMKLIYHIATSNPNFDMKAKLVNTLGGQHAYLVSLTRLAFSEGLVLEAGIEDAVVNMAHDILDEGLSPEEGDAFGRVFSSSNAV